MTLKPFAAHGAASFIRLALRCGRERFRPLVGASAIILIGLAACGAHVEDREDFSTIAGEVIDAGYTHISERYVDNVPMSEVALAGMQGIEKIDPQLHVALENNEIRLTDADNKVVKEFPVPSGQDPDDWADLTTRVIETARAVSPVVHDTSLEGIYEVVFDGALSKLDHFSRYAPAAVAREQRAQRDGFGGIGITIKLDGEDVRIVTVIEDSPAAANGVAADDAILEIDGQTIKGLALSDVVDRLRGPIGSTVKVKFAATKDRAIREVAFRRSLVVPPTVTYAAHGDVAYIRVTSFNQHTTSTLKQALLDANHDMGKKLRGAVIDLRGDPGGLLDQAVTSADLFLSEGRILSTSGRHPDSNQIFDADGKDVLNGLPVALLVNGGTASAAEVLAAALQEDGRAIVVGSSTYGKGTVQTVHRLPNDGEIIITWSRIYTPSGYTLNTVGVIPNVCTSKFDADTPKAVAEVTDSVKTDQLDTIAARTALHSNAQPNKNETRLLRASCPPKQGENALDLDVAQRILEDGSLFAHAMAPVTPEIAKRE
ncbi:MAG TPA: S41 family peptidase [Alphaproteobacteria bacterium]|nr:S41 family peptidase [Alphaproteobacteria bacterium]